MDLMPNQLTGANAGGARRLQIRALRAARIAQFWRSAEKGAPVLGMRELDRH
jgi:hypothetical protein